MDPSSVAQWIRAWLNGQPPANVWVGTSVEDQQRTSRIPQVLAIPAALRFLSVEPLLGPVVLDHIDADGMGHPDLSQIDALTGRHSDMGRPCPPVNRIDWVIVGGESGRLARTCKVEWVRSIVAQCQRARVPVFVKQLGANTYVQPPNGPVTHPKGGDPSEWPSDLRVRQFPEERQ